MLQFLYPSPQHPEHPRRLTRQAFTVSDHHICSCTRPPAPSLGVLLMKKGYYDRQFLTTPSPLLFFSSPSGGRPNSGTYPLIPVRAMPWMNCFSAKKKTTTMGKTDNVEPAISGPNSTS